MAIHKWHRSRVTALWGAYFFIVLVTWAANVRITDDYVRLLRGDLAWSWVLLFIPLFIITWRWTRRVEVAEAGVVAKQMQQDSPEELEIERELARERRTQEREYRLYTTKIAASSLHCGYELHARHFIPMGEDSEGWELVSLSPIEKQSTEEYISVLALIAREVN